MSGCWPYTDERDLGSSWSLARQANQHGVPREPHESPATVKVSTICCQLEIDDVFIDFLCNLTLRRLEALIRPR